MSDDPREIVAAEYGLTPEAAKFLVGETLDEVEASAVALMQLIGRDEGRDPDPAPAPQAHDPITAALAAKAQRKRALAAIFTGREPQRRDERGRFTGFDGGARKPTPPRRDPEREHGQLIAHMATFSRTFGTSVPWPQ
jgi:hypothetical protein